MQNAFGYIFTELNWNGILKAGNLSESRIAGLHEFTVKKENQRCC